MIMASLLFSYAERVATGGIEYYFVKTFSSLKPAFLYF